MFDFDIGSKLVFDEGTDTVNFVQEKKCLNCGTLQSEVLRTGIVGCSECYKFFSDEIKSLVFRKQGAVCHIGKVPQQHLSKQKLSEKIAELEAQKAQAVKEEDFISAESLKSQIEKLKGELGKWKITVQLLFVQRSVFTET